MKKSFLSALVFFGTVAALTVGYATWNNPFSMGTVSSGSGLTANGWNALVNNIDDLNARLSNITFSGGRVGIGTTSPGAKLEVTGGTTKLQQEAWNYPTLGGWWLNYGGVNYRNLGYRLDSMGYLRMWGIIKSGTIGGIIFNLPAGYRPAYTQEFIVSANLGNANVIILTNGNIYVETTTSNAWISFDNVSIPLD